MSLIEKIYCLHCRCDLTDLSINEKIKHLAKHREEMTERSKELLEIVEVVDWDAFNGY